MFLNTTLINDSLKIIEKGEGITEMIKQGRLEAIGYNILTWSIDLAWKIFIAFVIFFIGRWLIGRIRKMTDKITTMQKMDSTLQGFMRNALDVFLYILLFIIIINVVGTKTFSIAALIGSAGLAIGLAVKDNLANFAGGVMLLFNKPFKVGDYIEAQSNAGTVKSIGILYTMMTTADNKTIYIPNGPLSTGTIINISTQPTRRVEIIVSIQYGTDVEIVKSMLIDIAKNHPNVLKSPEPFARMALMNEHSIDFKLRVWVKKSDFWPVTFDLNEEIYKQINEKKLVVPFKQLTVHLADKSEDNN